MNNPHDMRYYAEGPHGEFVHTAGVPRQGDWIQSHSNVQFFPMDPRVGDIHLEDIAHALSHLCRFGGHSSHYYSVAQHSVLVSWHCGDYGREGLLHDATEAYLVDVPRPIKRHLNNYMLIEETLARVIGYRFGLDLAHLPQVVKDADEAALWTEKRDLLGPSPHTWGTPKEPWADRIVAWTADQSKRAFLDRARALGIR